MAQDNTVRNHIRASGTRILLGLDYGTDFTSLAWCGINSQMDGPADIIVYKDWPGVQSHKVPSLISYSPTSPDKQCAQWGWSIDDDSVVLRRTKLELEQRSTLGELESLRELLKGLDLIKELQANDDVAVKNDVPFHIVKTAEDIVGDYLRKVSRTWYSHMNAQNRYTLQMLPLDLIITYPDTWSYNAMNKLYRAVRGAFHQGMFPTVRNFSFVSEPEARALNIFEDMSIPYYDVFIPGECFVICNVDDNMTESASYCVDRVEPLELSRVGYHSENRCGANTVDDAFLGFLLPKLDGEVSDMSQKVLLSRFETIKRNFDSTGGPTGAQLTLPRGVRPVSTFEDSIINGVLSLSDEDIRSLFSNTLNGINQLIARQITQVKNKKHKGMQRQVTNILMAGSFSGDSYIFSEVTKFANRAGNCKVHRSNAPWTEAVTGAVLRGMDVKMVAPPTLKECPRNYGICIFNEDEVGEGYGNEFTRPDQIVWLSRRGDVILPTHPVVSRSIFQYKFRLKEDLDARRKRTTFLDTTIEELPSNMLDALRIAHYAPERIDFAHLALDLESIPEYLRPDHDENGDYFTIELTIELTISSIVTIEVKYKHYILARFSTNL